MQPGGPGLDVLPRGSLSLADLNARVDADEERAYQIGVALASGIFDRVNERQTHVDELGNQILGRIQSRVAARDDHTAKIAGSIQKNINRMLGQAQTYGYPFGTIYPSLDQVHEGLVTRDPFTALGVPQLKPGGVSTIIGGAGNDGTHVGGGISFGGPPPPPVQIQPPPPPPTLPGGGGIGGNGPPPPPPPTLPGGSGGGGGGPPPPPPPVSNLPPPVTINDGQAACEAAGGVWDPVTRQCGGETIAITAVAPTGTDCPPGYIPGPASTLPGGTGGGGTGGGGQDWCPPGYQWNPQYGLCVTGGGGPATQFMGAGDGRQGALQPPLSVCDITVSSGWTPTADLSTVHTAYGTTIGAPWAKPGSFNNGWHVEFQSADGCHLNPPYPGQFGVWIPVGAQLYAAFGQQLVWAFTQPTGPYVLIVSSAPLTQGGQPHRLSGETPPIPPPGPGPGPACIPDPGPVVCAPPPALPCAPPAPAPLPAGQAGEPDYCAVVDDLIKQWTQQEFKLAGWLGMTAGNGEGGSFSKGLMRALIGVENPIFPDLTSRFAAWLQKTVTSMAKSTNCDPLQFVPLALLRALLGFLEKWTGAMPEQVMTSLQQLSHTVCHVLLPNADAATQAWLADTATDDDWECWTKAAGHRIPEATKQRDGHRHRPTWLEAYNLKRRGWIDADRFKKLTRAAGVVNPDDETDKEHAADFFPAIGETLRWAVEQLFDPDIVQRFKLDQGFDELWQGRMKVLLDGHGIQQEFARYHYMATRRRPGINELFEMQARLRPDVAAEGEVFTPDDLDAALRQEGWNDYWRPRIKAISYRVAQRRDAWRLYQYHLVDEQGLGEILKDQRFSPDFAQQLTESWKVQRQLTENTYNAVPKASGLINNYAKGFISRNELSQGVEQISFYDGQDQEILANADLARKMEERRLAVSGLKAAFTKGLIGLADAQAALAQTGMDADAVADITGFWVRVKESKPKQVPAATLCQWRKDGLINSTEQYNALLNLKYSATDAEYIVRDCTLKIQQANAAAEQKALKAAQKAAEAAAKSAAKAARDAKQRIKIVTRPAPAANGTASGGP